MDGKVCEFQILRFFGTTTTPTQKIAIFIVIKTKYISVLMSIELEVHSICHKKPDRRYKNHHFFLQLVVKF